MKHLPTLSPWIVTSVITIKAIKHGHYESYIVSDQLYLQQKSKFHITNIVASIQLLNKNGHYHANTQNENLTTGRE